ncbi:MAG: LCP family protein [Vulcanimicrobiaceae bacterium]
MTRTRALAGFLTLGIGLVVLVFALASGWISHTVAPLTLAAENAKAQKDVAAAFGGKRRLNVLVLGNQDEEGTSDTMILAHLDLDRHTATLVSIPRDTWVAVDGHGSMKINSVIGAGGAKLSSAVVGKLTGAPIDATTVVQPDGAKQLVDAMGGLNVNIEKSMDYDDNYGDLHIHFKAGERYLTGGQVLEYMRFRHDAEGDFGRMRRQQQVVREIAHEMTQPGQWSKLPRLVALARKDVQTALNDQQLTALVEAYHSVAQDDVRTLTLPSRVGWVGDASVVFVDERWAKFVGEILCSPKAPPQDVVLVANATGLTQLDKVIVGALRGGGWNVQTFVDQPTRFTSEIEGSSPTADRLERVFGIVNRRSGKATVIKLGTDLAPEVS